MTVIQNAGSVEGLLNQVGTALLDKLMNRLTSSPWQMRAL